VTVSRALVSFVYDQSLGRSPAAASSATHLSIHLLQQVPFFPDSTMETLLPVAPSMMRLRAGNSVLEIFLLF
jgi:hypothetical protein